MSDAAALDNPHTPAPSDDPTLAERRLLRETLTRALPEIPPRYFYDDHGSALFERITELPVYYQTRTEIALLERVAGEVFALARPRHLVELGSGAGRKIHLLLDAWSASAARAEGRTCAMLDVNQLFLEESLARLRAEYPAVRFHGIVGDFTRDLDRLGPGGERLVVFFGGTMGNLYPDERRAFLRTLGRHMALGDMILVGVDLVKDHRRLEAAYDDPEGVTAAFNLNALRVLNERFGADFDPAAFRHRAFYDAENAWIEMRVVSSRRQRVRLPALDLTLDLDEGAEIRTEVSCKFTRESLAAAAGSAGLEVARWFSDPSSLFALALLGRPRVARAEGVGERLHEGAF